jgi:hypothetical protein
METNMIKYDHPPKRCFGPRQTTSTSLITDRSYLDKRVSDGARARAPHDNAGGRTELVLDARTTESLGANGDGSIFLVCTRVETLNHTTDFVLLVRLLFRLVHIFSLIFVVDSVNVVASFGIKIRVTLGRHLVEHGAEGQNTIVIVEEVLFLFGHFIFCFLVVEVL